MSLQVAMERSALLLLFVSCLYLLPFTFGKKTKIINSDGEEDKSYTLISFPGNASLIYCDQEYSCMDINTARICAPLADDNNTLVEIATVTCDPNTICDSSTGNCVPDPVTPVPPVPEMFTCMRDGVYPDVHNCSRYFQCVEELPYLQECSGHYPFYSPEVEECVKAQPHCVDYITLCYGYSGTKVMITNTTDLFAYCENDTVLVVDRCINGHYFNTSLRSCERYCPYGGLFPSAEDCAQYFACSGTSWYLMSSTLTCPEGKAFLESARDCVDRSLVPNCQVPAGALSYT